MPKELWNINKAQHNYIIVFELNKALSPDEFDYAPSKCAVFNVTVLLKFNQG